MGGAAEMPHFSEWNYSIYTAPTPCFPRILSAGTLLVEPPYQWRQEGSLVYGSASKSTHSASQKRCEDTEGEEMQAMPIATLAQLW